MGFIRLVRWICIGALRCRYEWDVVPHEPDPLAGELREYRPFPEHWIESLWSNEYAQAWPQLQANAAAAGEPPFPTPAQMIERTFVGNVAFEGDVREETEGSRVIAQAILDDDPRTLWLLSWGGMNTIVRALMGIAERYRDAPEWTDVQQRVYRKVRVLGVSDGVGQDNSWLDHGRELFPELTFWCVPYMYGGYVDAKDSSARYAAAVSGSWPKQNLTQGNGPLMARYMLYGDGKVYENEPERFQFGKHARLDWGLEGMPAMQFERGDFMAEGDSMTYIPLLPFGLRGIDNRGFDTLLGRMFLDGHPDADAPPVLPPSARPQTTTPIPTCAPIRKTLPPVRNGAPMIRQPARIRRMLSRSRPTAAPQPASASTLQRPSSTPTARASMHIGMWPWTHRAMQASRICRCARTHGRHRFHRARRRTTRRPLRAHPHRADARRAPLHPLRPDRRNRGIARTAPTFGSRRIRQRVSPGAKRARIFGHPNDESG